MKKIFLFTTLMAIGVISQGQKVDVGLKGGINLSSIGDVEDADFNNRLGYHAGVTIHVPVGSQLAVQPEVVYSNQGAKYTILGQEHNLELNYINIPLMLQAFVGRGFYAEAGPQVGFLIGAKDRVGDTETGFFTTDDFKKTDVAIGVGLGYRGRGGLGLNARYNLGLTDINDVGSNNLKNNVLQIGLSFNLSGR